MTLVGKLPPSVICKVAVTVPPLVPLAVNVKFVATGKPPGIFTP